ncbi:hypothetical protein K501DRAFT_281831 [Backusella circina FSU 941]|nr:hypothetical protein K501DRAFT_281831 [Backusella circina FSU 941]
MATLDNFGFKARKARSLTKTAPSKLIERPSRSFIVPVDIKPVVHKRKHGTTTVTTKSQQQTSITNYFNNEEEPIITCIIKNHTTVNEIWKLLEYEYTSLLPTPKTIVNKRRVVESSTKSPLKRQRTMDSLSDFMDRYLKVTEFNTVNIQEEEEEEEEVLIRPIKKLSATESNMLFCQIAQDFIIPF